MEDEQLLRYSRHILLPQVDIAGQEKLLAAQVLIVGMGGLGSPVAMYLAAAGVGHLWLCDYDTVEISNLQRQIVYGMQDIGRLKVEAAQAALTRLNPTIAVSTLPKILTEEELIEKIQAVNVVVDCSDNLETRLRINAACVQTRKPLVSGAAIRFEGQVGVFLNNSDTNPCYRCLYPIAEMPIETCTQSGVLAPLLGVIGSLQALETMKIIMNVGETLAGRLLLLDALHLEWTEVHLQKNEQCPVCGEIAKLK